MDKAASRTHFLALRSNSCKKAGPHVWKSFWSNLCSLPDFSSCKTILIYHSKESEAPTHEIIAELLAHGHSVALPKSDSKTKTMEARLIRSLADLAPANFGLLEPLAEKCPVVPVEKIDLLIVPLIAFDASGHRLGYGHGFYDRYLKSVQCPTAGLAFEAQRAEKLHHEAHDVPLDFVVTENGVIKCRHD